MSYILDTNTTLRANIAKLRLSDHKLESETGRYSKILRCQRICRLCHTGVEDPGHFLLSCSVLNETRASFFDSMNILIPNYSESSHANQLYYVLNPTEFTRLPISTFITASLKKRKSLLDNLTQVTGVTEPRVS